MTAADAKGKTVECPDCNGTGSLRIEAECRIYCYRCGGTGHVPAEEEKDEQTRS